jgi:hypothetical protein
MIGEVTEDSVVTRPHNHWRRLNLLCALFCQGAFRLGGQDWVERYRLVAGSYEVTPSWRVAGDASTVMESEFSVSARFGRG